jgi:hypothetical protein
LKNQIVTDDTFFRIEFFSFIISPPLRVCFSFKPFFFWHYNILKNEFVQITSINFSGTFNQTKNLGFEAFFIFLFFLLVVCRLKEGLEEVVAIGRKENE